MALFIIKTITARKSQELNQNTVERLSKSLLIQFLAFEGCYSLGISDGFTKRYTEGTALSRRET